MLMFDFPAQALSRMLRLHPSDAARALSSQDKREVATLLAEQDATLGADLLQRMNSQDAVHTLEVCSPDAGAQWVLNLEVGTASALLGGLEPQRRGELLEAVPGRLKKEIEQILEYPAGTAGKLMDRRFAHLTKNLTIGQALERLRAGSKRRVTELMLVDDAGKLEAMVPLHSAVAAPLETTLGDLELLAPISVMPMTSDEEVAELLEQHRLASVPVVDFDGTLLGVIRYEELLHAAQEDAVAAAQAMVGVSREERALSTPWTALKSRLPWLQINLATAFLASAVVGMFDATIAKITALAVLMPVVAGQSGNTGAQALAVTQRGLALREIRTSHVWQVVRKEAVVGLGAGTAVALVTALGVFIWSQNLALAGVISVAMVISMCLAAVSGAVIPIVLTALGRDPATASSIVLTTVTDIVGFLSFLGLATLMASALV